MPSPSYNHYSHRLRKLFLVLELEFLTRKGDQVLVQLARIVEMGGARNAGIFPSERYHLENALDVILERCDTINMEIARHDRLMPEEDLEREAYKRARPRANERKRWRSRRVRDAVLGYVDGREVFDKDIVQRYAGQGKGGERQDGD